MGMQKTITVFLLLFIALSMYFLFSQTKVNPLAFLLGASICMVIEIVLMCVYCCFKFQQTYRQSHSINLKRNYELDPEKQYQFEKIVAEEQFFFNKFTDQAKYFNQKNQIKSLQPANKDEYYFQQFELNQPKRQTMSFLKQIQSYSNSLNNFTDVLINFGQDLRHIERASIFQKKKLTFVDFEKNYPPEIPIHELQQKQRQIFDETKTKLLQTKGQEKKLLFPSWHTVLDLLKYIGHEFEKIELMRKSNSEMLTMIHKKVLEDFELLQNKFVTIGKQLNKTLNILQDLQKDQSKYQNVEFNVNDTNEPHIEMMYWFKKQFYEFRDLERRIKENSANFQQKNRQRKYYQQKLSSFRHFSQRNFMKTVKTCYIALLDSYHITVDESIKKIQQSFCNYLYAPVSKKPRVKNIVLNKNVNQALQAEKQYQTQYFKRLDYYENILNDLIDSMSSLGDFIYNLKIVFGDTIKNLKTLHFSKEKKGKYFTELTKVLLERSLTSFQSFSQLTQANQKMKQMNLAQLQQIKREIRRRKYQSKAILSEIDINSGPIQHKYNTAKFQLQTIYSEIQAKISLVEEFEQMFLLHSGRIKKIILTQLIDFFNYQKKIISIGSLKSDVNDNVGSYGNGFMEQTIIENMGMNNNDLSTSNQVEIGSDSLYSENCQLSPSYLKFLNQFLFVSFTEWKTSTFFKDEIIKELFIAFNKDPNESFSKIQVSEMEFFGPPPEVIWLKQLNTEQVEAFFDLNLAFKGTIKLKVNTIYKLIRQIPVEVVIQIQEFYCVMRFCFVPSHIGKGWFSFLGEPISKFKIVPSIGSYRFDIETLKSIFNNFLLNKLKKYTYPIKQKFSIPASKKDQDLVMIEKRFKLIEQTKIFK